MQVVVGALDTLRKQLPAWIEHFRNRDAGHYSPRPKGLREILDPMFQRFRTDLWAGQFEKHDEERDHVRETRSPDLRMAERLERDAATIDTIMSLVTANESEAVPLIWTECKTTRLYGMTIDGISMQSVSRLIRQAALTGCTEYDIQACNHGILLHLASEFGINTPALAEYIESKTEVRQTLADDTGLTVEQIKTALIMLTFDATFPSPGLARSKIIRSIEDGRGIDSPFEAVNTLMITSAGPSGYAGLCDHPVFRKLRLEIGRVVVEVARTTTGFSNRRQALAYALQSRERQALDAIREVVTDVDLLIHDAVIARSQVDPTDIEANILRRTGVPLRIGVSELKAAV